MLAAKASSGTVTRTKHMQVECKHSALTSGCYVRCNKETARSLIGRSIEEERTTKRGDPRRVMHQPANTNADSSRPPVQKVVPNSGVGT